MYISIITLFVLVGCADTPPSAPTVVIHDLGGDPSVRPTYLQAASGWAPLGFEFTFDDPDLPECNHWQAGQPTNCSIITYLFRVDNLSDVDGAIRAVTDPNTRAISIDSSVAGFDLEIATAHELGHVLLETGEHTIGGIMGGSDASMWDVDYALACQSIGICNL